MDILLDTLVHDIMFDNSDIPLTTNTIRDDVAQRLKIRLATYLGEWFLNSDVGMPYYQSIFKKGVTKASVDILFQAAILEEEGVTSIVEFNSSLDVSTRTYTLSFRVMTTDGVSNTITI